MLTKVSSQHILTYGNMDFKDVNGEMIHTQQQFINNKIAGGQQHIIINKIINFDSFWTESVKQAIFNNNHGYQILKISHLPTSSKRSSRKPLFKLHAFLTFNSRTYFLLRDYLRISTGYAAQKELNDLTESFNSQQVFFLITVQTTTCHLFFAKRRF